MTGNAKLNAIIKSQNQIGWTNFTQRRILVQFIKYKQKYYTDQDKRNPDRVVAEWGAKFIKNLLEMADEMWTFRCHLLHGEDTFTDLEEKRKALAQL